MRLLKVSDLMYFRLFQMASSGNDRMLNVRTLSQGVRREPTIGLLDAINLLLACIIGSGIFISAKAVLEFSGSYGLSIMVWVGSGFLCIMVRKKVFRIKAMPPKKKSVFVKKFEIEINAWEDRPSFALSETLWFFIGRSFFDEVFSRFLSSSVKKRHFFLEKECFEVFARNFR